MGLFKRKDKDADSTYIHAPGRAAPAFTFVRSDTHTAEVIQPPTASDDSDSDAAAAAASTRHKASRLHVFPRRDHSGSSSRSRSRSRSRSASVSSTGARDDKEGGGAAHKLSHRLLHRGPASSEAVPQNLPEIAAMPEHDDGGGGDEPGGGDGARELQWERRATILAQTNERRRSASRSRPGSSAADGSVDGRRGTGTAPVSPQAMDEDIQAAIRLHEQGRLEQSTAMFGRLADPKGANNPLSQVLYGLALRHGWGCTPDPAGAVSFLSAAASNAASIETLALQAGLEKGGAAKGELVLAIFELANCFRHGWGCAVDPVAAKQYYETAANLGDTDAMNEVAWCYEQGFGTKKDKFAAAKYYRLAETNGNKTLGNSWIWKDKYDADKRKK
ncbi:hypothetical protein P8C59_005672 [Phyllachora maydis]|uniref:HCP-like protein n=1 Tax=Phyllachora maydis TaxID=1825666 RepID=A0AAD9I6G2_9PEZI|nr:hypothetical protein P8C59_005672 [Phyllachora maydis]